MRTHRSIHIVYDCNIFESKAKMTNMSLLTVFGKCIRCKGCTVVHCIECCTADIKLIRLGILLAAHRMFSKSNLESMATMFPFLSSPSIQSISAQTVYYQSITFLVFVLCVRIIFWMFVGSAGDRKHEDWRQCVSKFVFLFSDSIYFFLMLRVIYEIWAMPFIQQISPVPVILTGHTLAAFEFRITAIHSFGKTKIWQIISPTEYWV